MWEQSPRHIYVAGHRGYPEKNPENTLISFQAAMDAGVDMVELDVRMTADRELVVIHDAAVDRTTDGSGLIREMTLSQAKALDAGIRFGGAFAGTRIPTFVEALELFKDRRTLLFNFELKEYPKNGNEAWAFEMADRALALIERYGLDQRCVINIFDATLLEAIDRKYDGRYKLHGYYPPEFLHVTPKDRDPYAYLYCACPFDKPRTAASYATLWSRGVQPWAGAWVKTEEDAREAVGYETPLITCNNPATILGILRGLGLHP